MSEINDILTTADYVKNIINFEGIQHTADNMMCLGDFVFKLKTAPFQTLSNEWGWRHPENARVGAPPASQYAGPEAEKIKLSGELYPEITGGMVTLDQLKQMADTGRDYPLVDGLFNYLGQYIIEKMSTTRTVFLSNGIARHIEFSIELKRVDDKDTDDTGATA